MGSVVGAVSSGAPGMGAGASFSCLFLAFRARSESEQLLVQCPPVLQWWHTGQVDPFHIMITVTPSISKYGWVTSFLFSGMYATAFHLLVTSFSSFGVPGLVLI